MNNCDGWLERQKVRERLRERERVKEIERERDYLLSGWLDEDDDDDVDDVNSDDDIYHKKNRLNISSYILVRSDTKNSF